MKKFNEFELAEVIVEDVAPVEDVVVPEAIVEEVIYELPEAILTLNKTDSISEWIETYLESDNIMLEGMSAVDRIKLAQEEFYSAQNALDEAYPLGMNTKADIDAYDKKKSELFKKAMAAQAETVAKIKADREKRENGVKESVEDLDEAVEISHDRYMRSHGKKARESSGSWMFTHKKYGDVDHNDKAEVHQHQGSLSDAKKSAKAWAKEHGHSTAYIMESVDLDEGRGTPGFQAFRNASRKAGKPLTAGGTNIQGAEKKKKEDVKDAEKKEVKESEELEEGAFDNLPGKASHILNKDVKTGHEVGSHNIVHMGTVLRHVGDNNYEVRAGRHKGKTVNLDSAHVNKLSESVEEIDEMAMDSFNHPTHGKVEWRNDSGAHTIETKKKDGTKVVHALGNHKTIAAKWASLKSKLTKESVEDLDEAKPTYSIVNSKGELKHVSTNKDLAYKVHKSLNNKEAGHKLYKNGVACLTEELDEAVHPDSVKSVYFSGGKHAYAKTASGKMYKLNHSKLNGKLPEPGDLLLTKHHELKESAEELDEIIKPRSKSNMTSPENINRKYSMYSKETLDDLHAKGDFRAKNELKRRQQNEEVLDEAKTDAFIRKSEKDDSELHDGSSIGLTKGQMRDAAFKEGIRHGLTGPHGSQSKKWGDHSKHYNHGFMAARNYKEGNYFKLKESEELDEVSNKLGRMMQDKENVKTVKIPTPEERRAQIERRKQAAATPVKESDDFVPRGSKAKQAPIETPEWKKRDNAIKSVGHPEPRGSKAKQAPIETSSKKLKESKSFAEFMADLEEGKIDDLRDRQQLDKDLTDFSKAPKKAGVAQTSRTVKGHSYGGSSDDNDGDEDSVSTKKPEEEKVVRGRGRPAGSKSGAR